MYVETELRAPLAEVWRATQAPEQHERWDLRFSGITYLPRPDAAQPQRFLYETRLGFGLRVRGEGETVGAAAAPGSAGTSALRFWSDEPCSLIRSGSGYWRYEPLGDRVRFLTRYDYETRFGAAGAAFDRLVFRPLMGWATAWSFDRLRLWLERGIDPGVSAERALAHALARGTLAALWIHQGLVPKLLAPAGEREIMRRAGAFQGGEPLAVALLGIAEIAFGAALLLGWRSAVPLWLTALLMPVLAVIAGIASPELLAAPFGPVTLNAAMAALAGIALLTRRDLPSAARCRRRPPYKEGGTHA